MLLKTVGLTLESAEAIQAASTPAVGPQSQKYIRRAQLLVRPGPTVQYYI